MRTLIPELLAMYPGLTVEPDGGAREESSMLDTLRVLIPLVMIAMYVLIAAFPQKLLEAVDRGRGGADRVCRLGHRPLDSGMGLWIHVAVRPDRGWQA